MNHEHDEDLRKARLYLTLDADEMANVRAEHEKYERRKAAMQYGDSGSPQHEAVTFAPLPDCLICGKPVIGSLARGMIGVSHRACVERQEQITQNAQQAAAFDRARDKLLETKRTTSGPWLPFVLWTIAAIVAGVVVPWVLSKGLFWLGGNLP